MSSGYLPTREAQQITWFNDFYRNLSTNPPGTYGIALNVIEDYNTTLTRYLTAYAVASNPETRTRPAIQAKKVAQKTLINATRSIVDVAQNWPQMTDEKRRELGITVRDRRPTKKERPTQKPYLEITAVDQNTVTLQIRQSKAVRAKPKGVLGVMLYSAVGPTAPNTESGWYCQGNTTKSVTQVQFPATVPPGSRVWFTAVYFNHTLETGPVANAIGMNLPGGAAFSMAA